MTDSEIIDRLGGTTEVAAALGMDPRVVSNWRTRGISAAGRYQVQALAMRRRFRLPHDFLKPRRNGKASA